MKKNQKNKLKTFFLCVLSLFILGCPDPNNADSTISVTSVTLDTATAEIEVAQTVQLTATVSPEDATNTTVTWTSSDETVATVSDSGLVTAVTAGTATITVTTEDGEKIATCAVTVTSKLTISVESVSLDVTAAEMETNDTKQLTATVSPDDATNQTVTWTSSDETVATVSDSGLVTAVATGSATITVTTEDGEKTATCAVTVTEATISVESVSLDITTAEMEINDTKQLTATVSPDDATNQTVTWTSSDETVATVSDSGLVTAVATGSATITVTTEDGEKTATCAVTVTEATISVESVSLDITAAEMETNDTKQLTATVSHDNATNQTVTWSSSDETVATVSDSGLVTAVATGSATITVTTEDGEKTATCAITVIEAIIPVESVTLDGTTAEMETNDTKQLTATVLPEDATNQNVTWESSDEAVATVSDSGLVKAVGAGSATITATAGGKSDTCAVTVVVPVESVSLDTAEYTLFIADTKQLNATVSPKDATNQTVTWESSDETVATVSDSGLVTAIAAGSATITVTTEDGAKTATCAITVIESGVIINFTGPADEEIDLSSDGSYILSKSDWDPITVKVDGTWDSYSWFVDGDEYWNYDEGQAFIESSQYDIGYHTITVVVTDDTVMYSKSLKIRITK